MKRLDKPTNIGVDNLLIFQKNAEVPLKILPEGKLSKYSLTKTAFSCLTVSTPLISLFGVNYISNIHSKPTQTTVKGEKV
jgi:hypothetical protein